MNHGRTTAPGRSASPDENGPTASSVPRASLKEAAESCPYNHPDTVSTSTCRREKERILKTGGQLGQTRLFCPFKWKGQHLPQSFFSKDAISSIWSDDFQLRLLTSSALFPGGDWRLQQNSWSRMVSNLIPEMTSHGNARAPPNATRTGSKALLGD